MYSTVCIQIVVNWRHSGAQGKIKSTSRLSKRIMSGGKLPGKPRAPCGTSVTCPALSQSCVLVMGLTTLILPLLQTKSMFLLQQIPRLTNSAQLYTKNKIGMMRIQFHRFKTLELALLQILDFTIDSVQKNHPLMLFQNIDMCKS